MFEQEFDCEYVLKRKPLYFGVLKSCVVIARG